MPKARQGPEDFAEIAFRVFQEAIGEAPATVEPVKNPAAVELGKLGGLKGGRARADKLSQDERVRIARVAATKRWSNEREKRDGQTNS